MKDKITISKEEYDDYKFLEYEFSSLIEDLEEILYNADVSRGGTYLMFGNINEELNLIFKRYFKYNYLAKIEEGEENE